MDTKTVEKLLLGKTLHEVAACDETRRMAFVITACEPCLRVRFGRTPFFAGSNPLIHEFISKTAGVGSRIQ
jgi:hypothetical protein